VKLVEQLHFEVDVANVEELIESHGSELSNKDLMELEADKVAEQSEAEAEDETVEEPRRLNTKEMAIVFREIASAMARFEKMGHNFSQLLKVNRVINDMLACYGEVYEEKRGATVQSSLDKFVRKVERPAPPPLPLCPCQPMTSPTMCCLSPLLPHLQIKSFVVHHQNVAFSEPE
jgi:hypothetical protein